MIIGNGIDIIEVSRIKNSIKRNDKFLNKIFSLSELNYINYKKNNPNTIAGLFAAKEAISKSLGTGIRDFSWKDIEIKHDNLGKPNVVLKNNALKIAEDRGIERIILSITHINDFALAFSISIGNNNNIEIDIKDLRIKNILPKRDKESHKGTYGRVGVIAGSLGMTGSNFLASTAALRCGSGLVYSFIPKSLNTILESKTAEIITKPVEDNNLGHFIYSSKNYILNEIKKVDVLALGPGIGVDDDRRKLIKEIMEVDIPIVLDADGINCISTLKEVLKNRKIKTVITPHPGELSRFLGIEIDEIQKNRKKYAYLTSKKYKIITVLKGNETIVSDEKGNTYINKTGNPGMATAGSGDVLTGMIASFIGQGIDAYNASILAVFLHGLAGDFAAKIKGEYSLIASDIIEFIPNAIKKITDY